MQDSIMSDGYTKKKKIQLNQVKKMNKHIYLATLSLVVMNSYSTSISSSLCHGFITNTVPCKYPFMKSSQIWQANKNNLSPKTTSSLYESLSSASPLPTASPYTFYKRNDEHSTTTGKDSKVGILLLNLGGPEKNDDVEGFLYNLFADPDIIRLPAPLAPLQSIIARGISKRRAPTTKEKYDSIGGGSPILYYSNSQATKLKQNLHEHYNIEAKCYIGMRYWKPFTEDALAKIREDKIDALVILPLYPHFSISTSGSSLRVLQEEFAKRGDLYSGMTHTVVPSWYDRPGYIKSMADLIQKELDAFSGEELEMGNGERHVLFSAHGVPQSYIEAGDPYQEHIIDCVAKISEQLPSKSENVHIHLAYQSRVGPIEWLRPYTDDVLPKLGSEGVKNLVVVPISFVSEHIETLEEIDMEYKELAIENGIANWRRCPALNTDDGFIRDMADMVVEALEEPVQTVTEACISNNCGQIEDISVTEQKALETFSLKKKENGYEAEKWNGRVAMIGVAGTVLWEMLNGESITRIFGH